MSWPALKIILAASIFDNGEQSRGHTYEYYHFFQTLQGMASIEFSLFDFMQVMQVQGRERMNQAFLDAVKRERPDLVLVIPFTDQLIPDIVDEINRHTITVGYFFDDMWRIAYARFWARHFRFITTSDSDGLRKFHAAGHTNVIFSPFCCNQRVFCKQNLPKKYDVSFVGQYHPLRAWYLRVLRRAGISVDVWGSGWGTGRLNDAEMIQVFNQSKINLNLSNCVSWDLRYLASSPRAVRNTLASVLKRDRKTREQVKGRHFEINACGSFQLSYYVEGLERCYQIGEEIAIYASPGELVEKIRHYLKYQNERETIAQRGYRRTLTEHTMEKRLAAIFEAVRLPRTPL